MGKKRAMHPDDARDVLAKYKLDSIKHRNELAMILKELRGVLPMTEIADRAGVSRTTLYRILRESK